MAGQGHSTPARRPRSRTEVGPIAAGWPAPPPPPRRYRAANRRQSPRSEQAMFSVARFFFNFGPRHGVPLGQMGANKSSRKPSSSNSFLDQRLWVGLYNWVVLALETSLRATPEQKKLMALREISRIFFGLREPLRRSSGNDLVNGVECHELDAGLGVDDRPLDLFLLHDFHASAPCANRGTGRGSMGRPRSSYIT